jgi:hypothetical protein
MGKVLNKKERYEKIKEAMDSAQPYRGTMEDAEKEIEKQISEADGLNRSIKMKPADMPKFVNKEDKSVKMPKMNRKDNSVQMPKVERDEYITVPKDTSRIPQFTKGGGIAIKGTKFKGVF